MWKYIKAAFGVRQRVALLGDVPLNALLIPIIIAAGMLHPAFWLIGLGTEAALIYALSSNERFRKLVDLPDEVEAKLSSEQQRQKLQDKLNSVDRGRFIALETNVQQTLQAYSDYQTPTYITETNTEALQSLSWTHLKLLFARSALLSGDSENAVSTIREQVEKLKSEIDTAKLSHNARHSKQATLDILSKRLKHFDKREQSLAEIDADLARIEAQVALALDGAKLHAKPDTISLDLDLASDTMQSSWYYGDVDDDIQQLESVS